MHYLIQAMMLASAPVAASQAAQPEAKAPVAAAPTDADAFPRY